MPPSGGPRRLTTPKVHPSHKDLAVNSGTEQEAFMNMKMIEIQGGLG